MRSGIAPCSAVEYLAALQGRKSSWLKYGVKDLEEEARILGKDERCKGANRPSFAPEKGEEKIMIRRSDGEERARRGRKEQA